jgi:small-conductance mechanosensitive channel
VPNAKLSQAITINVSLPDAELTVVVPVSVAYGSDLDQVERVTLEVARGVQAEVSGARRGFEPLVRFAALGDVAVQCNVILRAETWDQQGLVTSEFIRHLYARYRAEGIEIPVVTRAVAVKP